MKELPDLHGHRAIAIDLETRDDNLKEKGSGGVHKDGYILGVAVATKEWQTYLPINHPETDNWKLEQVLEWMEHITSSPATTVYGANIKYDLEWLRAFGCNVSGPFFDVLIAEPLIDENQRTYNLSRISEKYLAEEYWKQSGGLDKLVEERLGRYKGDARALLWKMPACDVAEYAKMDALCCLHIADKQKEIIHEQKLDKVFDLESRLIPVLLDMRFQGVRIDMDRVGEVKQTLTARLRVEKDELRAMTGRTINVNAAASIAPAFDDLGIIYPRTKKTKAPSFKADWLAACPAPLADRILGIRKKEKIVGTFLDGHLSGFAVNGRVHSNFNQLRAGEYGSVSGRFSSSKPNMQQIPSRDPEWASIIRSLMIPEDGEEWWKNDWSLCRLQRIGGHGLPPVGSGHGRSRTWES